jgi:uncharacterized protein YjbJ (UPF0337 family)
MDTDRIVGSAKSAFGKAEQVVGDAVADNKIQAEGVATETEGVVQGAIGQIKDAARDAVDAAASTAGSAYSTGAEMVAERPGSALVFAGLIGFALGVILTKGSHPPRRSRWQRIYDFE